MTVCSGLQESEKKTACKALKDQLQLTGFPVLEIKTECRHWKALGKGTDNILGIWATFLSQTINILLPSPWRFSTAFPYLPVGCKLLENRLKVSFGEQATRDKHCSHHLSQHCCNTERTRSLMEGHHGLLLSCHQLVATFLHAGILPTFISYNLPI